VGKCEYHSICQINCSHSRDLRYRSHLCSVPGTILVVACLRDFTLRSTTPIFVRWAFVDILILLLCVSIIVAPSLRNHASCSSHIEKFFCLSSTASVDFPGLPRRYAVELWMSASRNISTWHTYVKEQYRNVGAGV